MARELELEVQGSLGLIEGQAASKEVLTGAPLLRALKSGDVDAHVLLNSKEEAEAACRSFPEGMRIRGCLVVTSAAGAALAFPPRFTVDEHLQVVSHLLHAPIQLESLAFGEGLHVGGDLDLHGCAALSALPDDIHVGGHIHLYACASLSRLPELHAAGNLALDECQTLSRLPDHLRVDGHLTLSNCSALASLPSSLRVDGDLDIQGCSVLPTLPADLFVGGVLRVDGDCEALQELLDVHAFLSLAAAALGPRGGLRVAAWPSLRSLPNDVLNVGGLLDLSDCEELTALPENLHVGGELRLDGCSSLPSLPQGIQVGGLDLTGCRQLTQLPDGMGVISGSLNLTGCEQLASLPQDLVVEGLLDLQGCEALRERHEEDPGPFLAQLGAMLLPSSGLRLPNWSSLTSLTIPAFGSDLDLNSCTMLTQLPEGLRVEGDLDLTGCSSLTALPSDLRVGGSLSVAGCSSLASLPQAFTVGGDVELENTSALESLPATMLSWPLREDGQPHQVYLGGAGLSREVQEWLREAEAPGLRFHMRLEDPDDTDNAAGTRPAFSTATEAGTFWAKEAAQGKRDWALEQRKLEFASLPEEQQETLVQFLSRLRDAKEFGVLETRLALAKRVVAVLELIEEDLGVREELLLRMGDSLDACGDKPVWALNQMHLVVEVARARGDREHLRALGKRVMRLMVVHEHAKRKVDSLKWVDDVCVYLRFEIDLREALDLPVDATAMIFPSYIRIRDKELAAAKKAALAITDDQFEAWLAQWPEWQRQQRCDLVAQLGKWADLPAVKRRASLRKRLSRRLSQLLSLTGDKMTDPVTLDDGKSVWSLADLLHHWGPTGLDLHNSVVSVDQMEAKLRRCIF